MYIMYTLNFENIAKMELNHLDIIHLLIYLINHLGMEIKLKRIYYFFIHLKNNKWKQVL